MKNITEPEIMRIPLEEVCLNILATGLTRSCRSFLCHAAQPPPETSVAVALDRLREIGAITVHEHYESLTPLGRHLAQLPLDARLGKMLIYGALFKCVDPISTIVACLSAPRSVFASSFDDASQGSARLSKFIHQSSDFLTLVNVYDSFVEAESSGVAKTFCYQNFLNYATLQEVRQAKALYIDLLCNIGLLDSREVGISSAGRRLDRRQLRTCNYNVNSENEGLLHAVVLGGVYPNLARVTVPDGSNRCGKPLHLEQKTENLVVHASSANHRLPVLLPSVWLAFREKLSTNARRITVSVTCFVSEMAILLFANDLTVKHFERKVVADDWIEVVVAARTAVTIRTIRSQLDRLLTLYFERHLGHSRGDVTVQSTLDSTVDSIVKLFAR